MKQFATKNLRKIKITFSWSYLATLLWENKIFFGSSGIDMSNKKR